jgi:magnesium chelatase subunit I
LTNPPPTFLDAPKFTQSFSKAAKMARARSAAAPASHPDSAPSGFPFTAIVGQEELTTALIINAIDPTVGGVLAFGDRGTGKSTAVRALAALLPPIQVVTGCRYRCDPAVPAAFCDECKTRPRRTITRTAVPVVDLPLGVTEDRVIGALDLERALAHGEKVFEPGLLARANRGYLYIDEVNLLEDHIVDLLIDVAASGENVVERDGLSVRHPARFVLVGSGNPEEGELRPQLLDRFGLAVEVRTPQDLPTRVEIVRRRDAFERDRQGFAETWRDRQAAQQKRIVAARARLPKIETPDTTVELAARLCMALGTDGLRAELTLVRAARALAALEGAHEVGPKQLRRMAPAALRHRLRRDPLDEAGSTARIERVLPEILPE